jgi:hypothetical protein
MTDNNFNINDHINKKDLEIILEVNKKAIEIETEVAEQNEEIITFLQDSKKREEDLQKKMEKTYEEVEEIKKDLFKIQVLFLSGALSLILQIAQFILKK